MLFVGAENRDEKIKFMWNGVPAVLAQPRDADKSLNFSIFWPKLQFPVFFSRNVTVEIAKIAD